MKMYLKLKGLIFLFNKKIGWFFINRRKQADWAKHLKYERKKNLKNK